MFAASSYDSWTSKVSSSVNLAVDINIKIRLAVYLNFGDMSAGDGESYITTCFCIVDWNRVLDASTLLRTQRRVSDNMTSDLSKTCSLTIRFTSYRAHLRDEAVWWLSQERISSFWKWGNWVRVNLSLRVFMSSGFERFFADTKRVTMTRCSMNKNEESRSLQKDGSYWRGCLNHARWPCAAIITRT